MSIENHSKPDLKGNTGGQLRDRWNAFGAQISSSIQYFLDLPGENRPHEEAFEEAISTLPGRYDHINKGLLNETLRIEQDNLIILYRIQAQVISHGGDLNTMQTEIDRKSTQIEDLKLKLKQLSENENTHPKE